MLQEVKGILDKIEDELIDSSDKKDRAFNILKLFIRHVEVKQNDYLHIVMPSLKSLNFRNMRKSRS
jgi:hypothetical protein